MKRVLQFLLFFLAFSVYSPNNNTMQINAKCEIAKGNISHVCQLAVANRTQLQTICNISSSIITSACGNISNQSCSQNQRANGSKCDQDGKKSHLPIKKDVVLLAIQIALYAIVFLVGVTGNLLVLLTVTSKRMRSVRNMLIGNLAVADLITLLVCLPMSLTTLLVSWPFGTFVCRYFFSATDVVVSVSIITICVITMDRFRAIVYPFAKKMSLKVTLIVIAIIWTLSYAIVALPLFHLMSVEARLSGHLVCIPKWPSMLYEKAYRLVILIVLYVIPVILVLFCFICIVMRIRENIRFTRQSVRDTRSLARLRRRSRVVRMMFVIFITFTVCLLPIHLLLTVMVFYPPTIFWPPLNTIYHASLVILTANSAMNPIILYFLSSEFKRGFQEHCICYVLFIRTRGENRASFISKSSRSFNNQQLTTCLHLVPGSSDVSSTSRYTSKCHQKKELLCKQINNCRDEKENGKEHGNKVETAL